jgi:CrcB protein
VNRLFHTLVRNKMLLLMLGGALGTYLRFQISRWFNEQEWTHGFPYGTMFINATGSFILAIAAMIIQERLEPSYQEWFLLIGTGFCGGYTTFSTFEWETFKLVQDGSLARAFYNVAGSIAAGFAAVYAGYLVVRLLFPSTE